MREIPKPGQIYRHFKGNLYQIIAIARHSETLEALVIYQALYGDFQFYARPLHMFMSELDKEKYSDVKQRERFELVRTVMDHVELEPTEIINTESKQPVENQVSNEQAEVSIEKEREVPKENEKNPQIDDAVWEFLDAKTFEERMRIFTGMQHRLTDHMINIMAGAMDTEVPEGDLQERVTSLKNFLKMQVKFECNRIR